MSLIVVLACLTGGVASVAMAQRRFERAGRLEKIGGMLIVAGLVGLGFMLARQL